MGLQIYALLIYVQVGVKLLCPKATILTSNRTYNGKAKQVGSIRLLRTTAKSFCHAAENHSNTVVTSC